jgi:hypothetical protein
VAGPALLLLAAVQVADLRPGIARIATFFAPAEPIPILKLQDPVWSRYPVIRAVPAANQGPHWEEIAVAAATRRLTTDAIYLARADPARIAALREAVLARLREGRPEPATLYVLRDAEALAAARAGGGQPRLIDGLMILAPEAAASR